MFFASDVPYDPSRLFDQPLVEVTQSAVGMFQDCPQRYVFRYLMHLTKGTTIPLLVGTAVHAGLETFLRVDPDPLKHFNSRLRVALQEAQEVFDDGLAQLMPDQMSDKSVFKANAQVLACVRGWAFQLESLVDVYPFEVLAVEQTVRATATSVNDPLEERAAGKVDIIIRINDERLGGCWPVESKALSSIVWSDVAALDIDRQALWYLTMAPQKFRALGIESDPPGFVYNVISKPLHRSGKSVDALADYMVDRMCSDPSKYFLFAPVLPGEDTLLRSRRNVAAVVERMDNLTPSKVEMNVNTCKRYGNCPYIELCKAAADAGDPASVLAMPEAQLYHLEPPHKELIEDGEKSSGF